jgi:hypothetical protein
MARILSEELSEKESVMWGVLLQVGSEELCAFGTTPRLSVRPKPKEVGHERREEGYGIRGSGLGVREIAFRIQDSGFQIQNSRLKIWIWAGFLQTFCQDCFTGRKVRTNSQDYLTCAKRDFCARRPVSPPRWVALFAIFQKKVNLKAYIFAAEKIRDWKLENRT